MNVVQGCNERAARYEYMLDCCLNHGQRVASISTKLLDYRMQPSSKAQDSLWNTRCILVSVHAMLDCMGRSNEAIDRELVLPRACTDATNQDKTVAGCN